MTRTLDRIEWPVRTDRLTLRPAVASDAAAVFAYRCLDSIAEWVSRAQFSREEHADRFAEPVHLASTLIIERDGEVVGDLYFWVTSPWAQEEVKDQAESSQAEIGWILAPAHQGQGLATEAVEKLLELAFTGFGVRRLVAECFADNTASWRLMERVGMRREQYAVQDSLHRTRGWIDGMTYAILAEEWATRRATQNSEKRSGSSSD